jgi:hypothetical protein
MLLGSVDLLVVVIISYHFFSVTYEFEFFSMEA